MDQFIQAYELCKQNQPLNESLIKSLNEDEFNTLVNVCKDQKYETSLNSLCPPSKAALESNVTKIMTMLWGCQDQNTSETLMNLVKNTLDPKELANADKSIESLFKTISQKPTSEHSNEPLKEILGQDALDSCLHQASKQDDLSRVKLFLEEGANVHSNNDYALRLACDKGHLDVVQFLVEQGADVNANHEPLYWAAENGHLDVVQYLIEKGADVHAKDDMALRYAADRGHLGVVKYLVEHGADIRADDDWALRYAAQNGHLDVVRYLVGHGADIRAKNNTALRMASMFNKLDVIQYLVEQMKQDNIKK